MKYHIIPVTTFNQNSSLVWCKKSMEAVLIDPGYDAQQFFYKIKKFGVKIKKILLTHGHLDHIGAAKELAMYYRIPILGPHKKDKFLLKNISTQCKMFRTYPISVFFPDYWLKEGDNIVVGEEKFIVIHCPGHSPGHIVFWNKIRKFIFMGDVLFNGSIGRTDLPGGDLDTLLRSIFFKLMILEDDITFLPGHGLISTLGYEKNNNTFLKFERAKFQKN